MTQEANISQSKQGFVSEVLKGRSKESLVFPILLLGFQTIVVILFLVFVSYGNPDIANANVPHYYKSYSDVAIMMFIGTLCI